MTEDIGRDIGSKIGRVLVVDKRAIQTDQAKFLRIRVEVQINKPLCRGGYVKNDESGRFWVDFRYERLPTLCYRCGILGHDEKHCQGSSLEQLSRRQYGEWLKASGVLKFGGEKERLKEKSVAEKEGSASMVVDSDAGKGSGAGSKSSPAMVVDGSVEAEKGAVLMMEADQLEHEMNPDMSSHRKHGEQARWEETLTGALNSVKEQKTRDGQNEDRTSSVRTNWIGTEANHQVVRKPFGPDTNGVGSVSPQRINENEGLSGEKKNRPNLNELERKKPVGPEDKEHSLVDRTQPPCPNRVIAQGTKGRIKKIARDKGKA